MDVKFALSFIVGLCPLPCRQKLANNDHPKIGYAAGKDRAASTPRTPSTVPSSGKASPVSFNTSTGTGSGNHRAPAEPSRPPAARPSVMATSASYDSLNGKASGNEQAASTTTAPVQWVQPCHRGTLHRREGRTSTLQNRDDGGQVCPFCHCWVVPSAL